jgi:crotonobetaine/carnitine-CoA ligase
MNRQASEVERDLDTLPALLDARARSAPNRPFVWCGNDWKTLGELASTTKAIAAGLHQLGLKRGERVALLLPNRDELIEIFFAISRLGAIAVPLNPYLKGTFLMHQLQDAGASFLVADDRGVMAVLGLVDRLELRTIVEVDVPNESLEIGVPYESLRQGASEPPTVDVAPSDVMAIMYTSGTMGMPKGCLMTHGYYTTMPTSIIEGGLLEKGDRLATPFQFFHLSGQVSLLSCLVAEASVSMFCEFHASTFWKESQEHQATVLWGVGAMGAAVLAANPTSPESGTIRRALWAPMSDDMVHQWEERFSVPVSVAIYGQTECTPTTVGDLTGQSSDGSSGRAPSYLQIAVVDDEDRHLPAKQVGEIVVRPLVPNALFAGYWRNSEATVQASRNYWHHTGDLGFLDDNGNLHFVDRKKDALRRRGENVSSIELETAIATHPRVMQVAVHAIPSEMTEDDIKACIVLDGANPIEPEELFEFFASSLPFFGIPRYVEVLDELPTNQLGRCSKASLRERGITAHTWDFEKLGLRLAPSARR